MLCNFVLIEEYTTVAIDYYPTKCMKHNKKKKKKKKKKNIIKTWIRNFKYDSEVFKLIFCR